jgi:ABC-type transport system involved in Fe-S cluster assembly fused permease/ATPase subunit
MTPLIASTAESTPLLPIHARSNNSDATNPDEETGTSSVVTTTINSTDSERPTSTLRWKSIQATSNEAIPPSWSQALAEVSPFLRPRDKRHAFLAFVALLLVLLEKLIAVLPPLAIRRAVDAISEYSSGNNNSSSSSSQRSDDDDDEHTMADYRQRTAQTMTISIAVYFFLQTLDAATSALQSVCQRAVSLDAERRFASCLFSHLQSLGAAYHLERHAGELLRILSRGSDATSTIIDSLWFNLFPTFFEAAVVGTVFWKLLGIPSIGLTTIISVVLYLVYTVKVTNTRLEQRRKVLDRSEDVGRIETETLVNYETVVIFGREQSEAAEYDAARKEYTDERVNMLGLFAWLQLGQQSIRLAGTCIGLWLAGRATVYGIGGEGEEKLLSPGSFVVVQLYINQLFQPLSFLGFTYRQLTEALTDLEKAVKMLRSVPLVVDAPGAVDWSVALEQRHIKAGYLSQDKVAISSGEITFDNVSFQYKIKAQRKKLGGPDDIDKSKRGFGRKGLWGGRGRRIWSGSGGAFHWIKDAKKEDDVSGHDDKEEKVKVGGIQNVSFHIPAGKTAALVGPSKHVIIAPFVSPHYHVSDRLVHFNHKGGSGKTTIVRLILRMYDPDEGSVLVDGMNVKALLQQSLRSNIGVVAQDTVLFHASLRDNIVYGKESATDDEVWESVRISALEPLVKSLPEGLDTIVGERGMKLSGGERQRVGLARCVIKNPRVRFECIILDPLSTKNLLFTDPDLVVARSA